MHTITGALARRGADVARATLISSDDGKKHTLEVSSGVLIVFVVTVLVFSVLLFAVSVQTHWCTLSVQN